MEGKKMRLLLILLISIVNVSFVLAQELKLNEKEYFEKRGLNVIVLNDIYPEGHQGGITIIQHGKRVAANGNLSLQPTPGQWEPFPKLMEKKVLKEENKITARLMFPDSNRIKTSDQPIIYPDFEIEYQLNVSGEGENFKISVDLDKPLPKEWVGKVAFYIELFPGNLFGKSFSLDNQTGIFPQYANTPVESDGDGEYEAVPMAVGKKLVVAPEDDYLRMQITDINGELQLVDGRVKHNNGWFVVRSLVPEGATEGAVEWLVEANTIDNWIYEPVIQISQVGYHPEQEKFALVELDKNDTSLKSVKINKILPEGGSSTVITIDEKNTLDFVRYHYIKAEFSEVKEPGMYYIQYGEKKSVPFKIADDVYNETVWAPTLEYFLPVQMCHMKIFEKYRVWHDVCHLDDALTAPENINHFDVYTHGELPEGYKPFQHIEGLDVGGWHDAGDYDFRIESQIGTILTLTYAYEEFNLTHDQTLIDQEDRIVEIHHPDGKPDALQQIEHGLLTVLGGYREFGQLYRGILCPTLRQYALNGDAGSMTDNIVFEGEANVEHDGFWYDHISTKYDKHFSPQKNRDTKKEYVPDLDDRFVFLHDNPASQLQGAAGLAAASRVMKGYDDKLAEESLNAAKDLYNKYKNTENNWAKGNKVYALAELIITTGSQEYIDELVAMQEFVIKNLGRGAWVIGRVLPHIDNPEFAEAINKEIWKVKEEVDKASNENPFGIPYHPHIWGAGWGIQSFGYQHYFLYQGWPEVFTAEPLLNALNFVLGCHPGENNASFASNVGSNSITVAYGVNRADWSYIPGGVVSGTNLIRPDLPELLEWPFLWQQTEYVMGGGATKFMFLALGANKILNKK